MRRGVDTNVLIYAHMPELPHHVAVRGFLRDQLARDEVTLVITPAVLHEFLHVVTDGRRFDPPVAMAEALTVARVYLEHPKVECVSIDAQGAAVAFELMERHQLGRKRIADTQFAASLLGHGVHELITCNTSDFKIFDGLALVDPRSERPGG
ncbi:MAG: TA system VapC family ribonuclease toxin [Acidobacteriota bacterium]